MKLEWPLYVEDDQDEREQTRLCYLAAGILAAPQQYKDLIELYRTYQGEGAQLSREYLAAVATLEDVFQGVADRQLGVDREEFLRRSTGRLLEASTDPERLAGRVLAWALESRATKTKSG